MSTLLKSMAENITTIFKMHAEMPIEYYDTNEVTIQNAISKMLDEKYGAQQIIDRR